MARASGWVPNQHGAWAMLAVPAIVGSTLQIRDSGLRPAILPLLAGWLVGYFAFHAVSLWLKSRRRRRYLAPVLAYGAATAVLALATLLLAPGLLRWAPAFAPLLGIGLYEAHRRRERSLLSGTVTVVAACLLVLVLWTLGRWDALPVVAWLACTTYFFGTVLVVKTMIRERGSRGYLAASIGYHAASAVLFALLGHPALGLFFTVCTVRAALLPYLAARGLRLRPMHIGLVEIVLSAALAVLLLA